MSPHQDDHLPPELRDVAEHLRAPHVTPSDEVLDAAITRAQRVRPDRRRGLSLRASGGRMSGRMRAIAVAGAFGLVGMTGAAVVVNSSGSGGAGVPVVKDAALAQYVPPEPGNVCPDGSQTVLLNIIQAEALLVLLQVDLIQNETIIANIQAQLLVPNVTQITVCVDI